MVDPDKPMIAGDETGWKGNLNDYDPQSLALVLTRAIQAMASILEQETGSNEWKKFAYKTVFEDTTMHNNEGTGSSQEKSILKANDFLAQLLKLENE